MYMTKSGSMNAANNKRGKKSSASTVQSVRTKTSTQSTNGRIEKVISELKSNLEEEECLIISEDNHCTSDMLTESEKTMLIAIRAKHIDTTGITYIDPKKYNLDNAADIAELEFEMGLCPFKVRRCLSNLPICELIDPNKSIR